MRIQYKHQKFQADAAKAVVDVFAGQPYLTPSYMMDRGTGYHQMTLTDEQDFTGWSNSKIIPELNDQLILEHLQKIQRANQIAPSSKLEGRADDARDEVVSNRVKTYHEKTEPLIAYYKAAGLYREIDGVGTIEEVRNRIFEAMEK